MTLPLHYSPAPGDWVTVQPDSRVDACVATGAHQVVHVSHRPAVVLVLDTNRHQAGTRFTPQLITRLPGQWLPGWTGWGSYAMARDVQPATLEETQAAQLDQLQAGGL